MFTATQVQKILGVVAWICVGCIPATSQEKPQLLDTPLPKSELGSPTTSGASNATFETSIEGLIRGADQAARNRDYSTCAQMLEQVVSIDPNYKNGWNYLGWTYNALAQYGKAEAALRKAIATNPDDPQAYNNLGQSPAYQKRYDEAIPQYL